MNQSVYWRCLFSPLQKAHYDHVNAKCLLGFFSVLFIYLLGFFFRSVVGLLLFVKHSLDLWVHQTDRIGTKWLHIFARFSLLLCTQSSNIRKAEKKKIENEDPPETFKCSLGDRIYANIFNRYSYFCVVCQAFTNLTSTIAVFVQFNVIFYFMSVRSQFTWIDSDFNSNGGGLYVLLTGVFIYTYRHSSNWKDNNRIVNSFRRNQPKHSEFM